MSKTGKSRGSRKKRGHILFPWIVFSLIFIYVAIFSYLAFLKYISFSFHDIDLAIINQTFWNTAHGHFIPTGPGESTILNGGHIFLIILMLTPLYAVIPHPLTLLVLQSLALGLGAWAIFLLARNVLNLSVATLFAAAYLIYPALNYVNLYEFHVIALATPLLLFMFYFYYKNQWGAFLLFMFLALACREDVAISIFAIGVFILIQSLSRKGDTKKRAFKWWLLPLVVSIAWFIVSIKIIQPYFRPESPPQANTMAGALGYYSWLGGSVLEIVQTIIFHPGKVLEGIFIKQKLLYLFHLFVPVAFLSLFSPTGLVMNLISLSEGLLSERFTHYSIRYQYSSLITPLIFISAIFGMKNILRWRWWSGKKYYLLLPLMIAPLMSAWFLGPLFNLPDGIKSWSVTPEDKVRDIFIQKIPDLIPVMATFEFTPALSMRPELFYFYHVYSASRHRGFDKNVLAAQEKCRYLLVDFNDYLTFYDFYTPGGDRDVYRFLVGGNWQLEETVNSICLFRKGAFFDPGVISRATPGTLDRPIRIRITPQLELTGYRLDQQSVAGSPTLEVSIYFACSGKIPADLCPVVRFVSKQQPDFSFQQELFAPYRIYPTSRWQANDRWKLSCNILIPPAAPPGPYNMEIGLLQQKGRGFTGNIIYRSGPTISL
jgi:uncharacterized membrane protein